MLTKAGDALESAFQTWNNRRHWNFLKDVLRVPTVAPFSLGGCTTTINLATVSGSFATVAVGDLVTGAGIRDDTYVISIDIATVIITLSQTATATATVSLTFARRDYLAPTNIKYIYNMRNLTTNTPLHPIDARLLDNLVPDQDTQDEPLVYDMYPLGALGMIRFAPTPNARYVIEMKFYRRMTVPSSGSTALDIPIDFEWGVMADAKAIFLAEKGGYDNLAAFWDRRAKKAIDAAIIADNKQPDETTGFLPAYYGVYQGVGNTIATTDLDY